MSKDEEAFRLLVKGVEQAAIEGDNEKVARGLLLIAGHTMPVSSLKMAVTALANTAMAEVIPKGEPDYIKTQKLFDMIINALLSDPQFDGMYERALEYLEKSAEGMKRSKQRRDN